ncbi:acetoacetate--CoA ligase [Kineosporia sp. NBRC 101731]|uniref:acetoacetate--CoA ligase n=1 Tax=Kineosporia sp. NBRC 101731 TaxID=3032199 RepID=UPI0024A0E334|nr:acetoacetate--CoA ligase [Kineosporia sp. NBRC 101731]GLY31301.1 acetoacetyl-CoA synthetase [Kineosporia sp. NBRC 101731]
MTLHSDSSSAAQLWRPDADTARHTQIADFTRWLATHRQVQLDELDYSALHRWSVEHLEDFWSAAAEYLGVRFGVQPEQVLGDATMPGAQWFPGATLNYAEHALTPGPGRQDGDTALIFVREDGVEHTLTHARLRDLVGRARVGLVAAGVGKGDRVVALVPNGIGALVLFLASASLGAIWSSCSPDFGARAVTDRFAQIEPTVMLAVDGYVYNGKGYSIRDTVTTLRESMPSLNLTVILPYLDLGTEPVRAAGEVTWDEFTSQPGELAFEPVPFDHPLWVLYSSGTTGLPKGIVQGHGGILLEQLKSLRLQHDLRPGEVFFWFTTTGWMMWNFLVGGLLAGCTILLYDGSPAYPGPFRLWELASRHRVKLFGVSAPFIQGAARSGIVPRERYDLSAMESIGSTGSPLSPESFRWIGSAVGPRVRICSVSGGTDVCTAFLTSAPTVPIWLGELSCASLGADVHAFDEKGEDVVDEVGELVITRPMPSMPVSFWNDPDGTRLREAYFENFPGLWRHGDWVRATTRGSFVIHGRSDSTLNRGGVRMGTAEFYAVVEAFDEVSDSLVIDSTQGELLCFLVMADGAAIDDVEEPLRKALRAQLSPRHVPDRFIRIPVVPRTLNGKKCEVPVKKILAGVPVDRAVSRDALADPDSLRPFLLLRPGS